MTNVNRVALVGVGLALLLAGTGCPKSAKPSEGPMEKAGKKVDNAAEETKEKAEDVKDDLKKK